jgi:asparagine N-glycosylation enzyme membrane subunit Stt3
MKGTPTDYWFPVKSYGWGWGPPVKWQGWLVLVVYFVLQLLGIRRFNTQRDVKGLLLYLFLMTALLMLIVVVKGERPAGWRWGKK